MFVDLLVDVPTTVGVSMQEYILKDTGPESMNNMHKNNANDTPSRVGYYNTSQ